MDRIRVVYRIFCSRNEVRPRARAIALEQTVEVPESLVTPPIDATVVGRIESEEPYPESGGEESWRVEISYDVELSAYQVPQLLNLIYGNTTIQPGVRLVDLTLPGSLLDAFAGPNFGIAGVRRMTGVFGRPLLASALKPRGSSVETFASIAYEFALGGGDIIKDDQNLVEPTVREFGERVKRCHDAVQEANAKTGRNTIYLPYIGAPLDQIEGRLQLLQREGIRGYLIAPMLMGMETTRYVAERHRMIVMAHPSFTGTFYTSPREGLDHGLLLGTLFRLIGTDVSVFTNVGGRFSLTRDQCLEIGRRLREPLGDLAPAFPSPAGGMQLDDVSGMIDDYGEDAVLLIGGALLSHSESVRDGTRAFLDRIRARYDERLEVPHPTPE